MKGIFDYIWAKAGMLGLILSSFSIFKLMHDMFFFDLAVFFSKLLEFWNAYPIRMVGEFFALFTIQVTDFAANIITLFGLYAIIMYRTQRHLGKYLAENWKQEFRKDEGVLSLFLTIPISSLFLIFIEWRPFPYFVFSLFFLVLICLMMAWFFMRISSRPELNLFQLAVFSLAYIVIGVLLGAASFSILFAMNYAFL